MSNPTASEVRYFLKKDFVRLETALNDVRVSLGGSPLVNYSAMNNWQLLQADYDFPSDVLAVFDMVVRTRSAIIGGSKLTNNQLLEVRLGIVEIIGFLRSRFPLVGIEV